MSMAITTGTHSLHPMAAQGKGRTGGLEATLELSHNLCVLCILGVPRGQGTRQVAGTHPYAPFSK